MSRDVKDKDYQQQILFNEVAQPVEAEDQSLGQVIFDADSEFEAEPEDSFEIIDPLVSTSSKTKKRNKWIQVGLLALGAAVVIEMASFFVTGFQESPFVTTLYAIALGGISVAGMRALFGEWHSLSKLKSQQQMQAEATRLLQSAQVGEAERFCQQVSQSLPEDISNLVDSKWYQQLTNTHTDAEIVRLYSKTVLVSLDKQARSIIAKHASESALLVTLSPVALMDMFIVLWRNFRMIEQIAALYGMRLGYRARIRLVKQVLTNAVFAAGSEILMDFGLESIGAELGGKLTGSLAQGLASGLLTARLGINTIKICRPIPFDDGQAPRISDVRKLIVRDVTRLLTGSKKQ